MYELILNTWFRIYTALTSDVIARCGFGVRVNSLLDPENIFVQKLKIFAGEDNDVNFMLPVTRKSIQGYVALSEQIFMYLFPNVTILETLPFLIRLAPFIPAETLEFFNVFLKNAMKARRDSKTKINDFVDTLNEMMDNLETEEYKKHKISETTVMCQALIFFLAGNTFNHFVILFLFIFSEIFLKRRF